MNGIVRGPLLRACVTACAAAMALLASAGSARAKSPYRVAGQYVEGCNCMVACPCDMTGLMNGCIGVDAMSLTSGMYNGVSLAGAKVALAMQPGSWVRAYVDARNPKQAAAARAFARSALSAYGKVEFVKDAKIDFRGQAGRYNVKVNGGRTMQLSTVPIIGADRKTAIVHSNLTNPLNHTFYQGRTVSGTYNDGEKKITLKGSNSYFNSHMRSSGRV